MILSWFKYWQSVKVIYSDITHTLHSLSHQIINGICAGLGLTWGDHPTAECKIRRAHRWQLVLQTGERAVRQRLLKKKKQPKEKVVSLSDIEDENVKLILGWGYHRVAHTYKLSFSHVHTQTHSHTHSHTHTVMQTHTYTHWLWYLTECQREIKFYVKMKVSNLVFITHI